jgi:hypothetical protein
LRVITGVLVLYFPGVIETPGIVATSVLCAGICACAGDANMAQAIALLANNMRDFIFWIIVPALNCDAFIQQQSYRRAIWFNKMFIKF